MGIDSFNIATQSFQREMVLPVTAGVDVIGTPIIFDLADAPHLLIGGTTGSGKSVCTNSILLSLILAAKKRPISLALIDPKQVEFSVWQDCNCLFADIADNIISASNLLDDLISEMEDRFSQFKSIGVKDIYQARSRGYDGNWIVVAVDELADLIMQDKTAQPKLIQLAQKSRAAGIHLILATQRPDANTFNGLLRSNCPSRIALKVQKSTESKIILDEIGAEALLGAGDMLLKVTGMGLKRAHGYHIQQNDIIEKLLNI